MNRGKREDSARSPVPLGAWIVAWWTAFGVISAVQYRQMAAADGRSVAWLEALMPTVASAWLWIPATWLALEVTRRAPLAALPWRRTVPLHLLATLGVVVYRAIMVVMLNDYIRWYRALPAFGDVLVTSVFNNVFFYWLITAAAHAVYYAKNARLREAQLADARLHALTAQLQPHFLFNALNTIATLVHENPRAAERVVVRLSELMRKTLDVSGQELVPLREEVRLLESYLEVEHARFEDRLLIKWDISAEAANALVPHFILQPIVENSMVHGVGALPGEVTVRIGAKRTNGRLAMTVSDTGPGFDVTIAREGVGLGNTRARLDAVYNGDCSLDILSERGKGTTVRVTVPYRDGSTVMPAYGAN